MINRLLLDKNVGRVIFRASVTDSKESKRPARPTRDKTYPMSFFVAMFPLFMFGLGINNI